MKAITRLELRKEMREKIGKIQGREIKSNMKLLKFLNEKVLVMTKEELKPFIEGIILRWIKPEVLGNMKDYIEEMFE